MLNPPTPPPKKKKLPHIILSHSIMRFSNSWGPFSTWQKARESTNGSDWLDGERERRQDAKFGLCLCSDGSRAHKVHNQWPGVNGMTWGEWHALTGWAGFEQTRGLQSQKDSVKPRRRTLCNLDLPPVMHKRKGFSTQGWDFPPVWHSTSPYAAKNFWDLSLFCHSVSVVHKWNVQNWIGKHKKSVRPDNLLPFNFFFLVFFFQEIGVTSHRILLPIMAIYEIIMSASVQASKLHSISNIGYCLNKKSGILSKQSLFLWEVANDRCDKSGGGQNLKKKDRQPTCV